MTLSKISLCLPLSWSLNQQNKDVTKLDTLLIHMCDDDDKKYDDDDDDDGGDVVGVVVIIGSLSKDIGDVNMRGKKVKV